MSTELLPGVDKIWLSTKDFSVKNGAALGFRKQTKPGQTEQDLPPIFIDESGNQYRGQQAEYRGQNCDFYLGVNQKGLSLQFNPSKIIHKYNLLSDVNVVGEISKSIYQELNDVGINFNLNDTRVSRLDFAKQPFMDRHLSMYIPVFNHLEGKRMRGQEYDTGYTFMNGRHESCFYSKGAETGLSDLDRMLRGENRWKDSSLIGKSLGFNRYSDFLKSDAYEWNEHYNRYLLDKIFRKPKQGQLFDFNNEVSKLKYFKDKGQNALNNYLIVTSLDYLLENFGKLDILWSIMKEAGYSRQFINTEKKRMRELIKLTGKNKVVSIGTLINELIEKFAA